MKRSLLLSIVLAGLCSAAPVRAQRMYVMAPLDAGTEVGGQLMFGSMDVGPVDSTLIGLEAFLRHRIDRLLLEARLPVGHFTNDARDGTSLGNLTGGLSYLLSAAHSGGRIHGSALGLSLSLPTAADGGDARVAAMSHAIFHVPDRGLYLPDTTTLRLHGDYRIDADGWFFQTQLGTQFLIIQDADDQLLFRLGLGGGVDLSPQVALVAELTTVSDKLDDSGTDEDFWHTLDMGIRYRGANSDFGARLYYPLDASLRDLGIIGLGLDLAVGF